MTGTGREGRCDGDGWTEGSVRGAQGGRLTRVGAPASRERQLWRQAVGRRLAADHGGVVRRADLLAEGLTDHDVRVELARGVWHRVGRHTISVEGPEPAGEGKMWRALWESGPRSVLDGVSALQAAGLKHWQADLVEVSVPRNATIRSLPGVRHHVLRDLGPVIMVGLRRTKPEVATLRAAEWAVTDRQAATLIAMAVQQRLVSTSHLLERWESTRLSARRALLTPVIRDICDGAHSINELDVGAACRARGLPEPSRQEVRTGARGRVYLDLFWDEEGVHVEIQGAHHFVGLKVVDDSLRLNGLAIRRAATISLQIPVLGWRLHPDQFLDQIQDALEEGRRRKQGEAGA